MLNDDHGDVGGATKSKTIRKIDEIDQDLAKFHKDASLIDANVYEAPKIVGQKDRGLDLKKSKRNKKKDKNTKGPKMFSVANDGSVA